MLLSTLLTLALSADPFAVLQVPDAGWSYVESGPDAGTATHTWTTHDVTHVGPYTSFWLQGDDTLPTVRVFVGPRGLSAAVEPGGAVELTTAAAISQRWTTPNWGLFLPAKLVAGTRVRFSVADPQLAGTFKGTLRASPDGGVALVATGRACFLGACELHTVELTFAPRSASPTCASTAPRRAST